MARMSFSAGNRSAELENFPKFRLEAKESARLVVLHEPESAFVHNLRAPKIINGVVEYKGEEMEFDFIGNPICLGDETILNERGIDAKNCPACKAIVDYSDWFARPKRRYATHVYQYQTNGTNKAPADASGTVKVWAFADGKFNELIDIFEEAEVDSPKEVDLIAGPCEAVMYQKFKIIPGQKTAYKANDNARARFEESVEANKSKDLYRYIGRKMSSDFVADKVDEVLRKWRQANGQSGETASDNLAGAERTLDAGLNSLLDNDTPKTAPVAAYTPSASNNEATSFDDILKGLEDD